MAFSFQYFTLHPLLPPPPDPSVSHSYMVREDTEKVATVVVSELGGSEERKKRNDRYEEECQLKVEGRNKARIKMLNRRTRMNIENYTKINK